jgi:hypothetical protein
MMKPVGVCWRLEDEAEMDKINEHNAWSSSNIEQILYIYSSRKYNSSTMCNWKLRHPVYAISLNF